MPMPLPRKSKPTANINKVAILSTTQNCATQFRMVAPPMTKSKDRSPNWPEPFLWDQSTFSFLPWKIPHHDYRIYIF